MFWILLLTVNVRKHPLDTAKKGAHLHLVERPPRRLGCVIEWSMALVTSPF